MDLRKLQRLAVDALEDVKGQDIVVFDTSPLTTLFDRVLICTGTSSRHTVALARSVADKAREAGIPVLAFEGEESGEWVLVDLGDIVVHVLQPSIRTYYNLEEVWGGKKVSVRLGPPAKPATAAAVPAPVAKAPSAAKPVAKKAAKKTTKAATEPAAKKATKAASKPAAKKATKAAIKPVAKKAVKAVSRPVANKTTKTAVIPAARKAAKAVSRPAAKKATKSVPKSPAKKAAKTSMAAPKQAAKRPAKRPAKRAA